jgi:hypothetical protein
MKAPKAIAMIAVFLSGSLLAASEASAAVRYVDGGCSTNGNGSSETCATSSGGNGAFNSLQGGLNALAAAGDVLNVRGVHGTFDGRYNADRFWINGKNGSASNPIIVQSYNFGMANQETVYIESTMPGTWTKCTSLTCAGAPSVNETWVMTKSNDGSNRAYWGQKPDGSITPRKVSLTDLTNLYDAYSCEACPTLYVRWGGTLPAKAYINYANNGNGFKIDNSSYVTVRGFVIRATIRAGIEVNSPNTGITIDHNKFQFISDSANGSGRPLTVQSPVNITMTDNEFSYSSSEPIHIGTGATGRASGRFARNWVHDIGDRTVLGPGTGGTPNCTTFTSDAPAAGSTLGDFSGFIVEGNVFERCYDSSAILFESHCDGMIVRDNVIRQVPLAFKFSPDNGGSSQHTSNNKIYNNIVYDLLSGTHNGAGNCFLLTGASDIKNNVVWNNTCVGILNRGVESQAGANNVNNQFFNNIFTKSGSGDLLQAAQAITFQNNLLWNGSATGRFGTISGSALNCGTNGNKCGDPLFVNSSQRNFHLQATSPAINGGTITGLPTGRTKDVCNSLAAQEGMSNYGDCQSLSGTWDIGADEFGASVPSASLILSDAPPIAAGSVTVSLSTSTNVVLLPGLLTFTESDGTQTVISLTGTVPGSTFSGVFTVDATVSDGLGAFSLPLGSLVDSGGLTGNAITSVNGTSGGSAMVDKLPPTSPSNLRFGN